MIQQSPGSIEKTSSAPLEQEVGHLLETCTERKRNEKSVNIALPPLPGETSQDPTVGVLLGDWDRLLVPRGRARAIAVIVGRVSI